MEQPIVHLCYAGTSGASRVAINIAHGSAKPSRHAYVLYGAGPMREDYAAELTELGCQWRFSPKRPGVHWRDYRATARAIRDLRPAVVILHGSRTLPVAIALRMSGPRVPILAVQHGPEREITSFARRCVCVGLSMLADRTVTVSREMAALISRRPLLRRACGRLGVIINGVDADYWRAEPPTIDPRGTLAIGMVSTLESYKDQPTLLRAARLLSDRGRGVRVYLVGGGSQERTLRALAEELGLAEIVRFEGDLARPAVREIVHRLDVMVHATHSEACPMAIVEAMLSARPIVASDVPGPREVVQPGQTGLLVPEGDADALAAAIARLAEDPALARRLAVAGRELAIQRFSAQRMAAEYERLADEMRPGNDNGGPGEATGEKAHGS